jgi:hypothetical protein
MVAVGYGVGYGVLRFAYHLLGGFGFRMAAGFVPVAEKKLRRILFSRYWIARRSLPHLHKRYYGPCLPPQLRPSVACRHPFSQWLEKIGSVWFESLLYRFQVVSVASEPYVHEITT